MTDFDERLRALDEQIASKIDELGWFFMAIFPTHDQPGPYFCYTIGVSRTFNHPELCVFGLAPEAAHGFMSCVIDEIKRGRAFTDGERVNGLAANNYDIFFRSAPAHDSTYPLTFAARYLRSWDFPVLQLVIPDVNNRFPWEEGVDEKLAWGQQHYVRVQEQAAANTPVRVEENDD